MARLTLILTVTLFILALSLVNGAKVKKMLKKYKSKCLCNGSPCDNLKKKKQKKCAKMLAKLEAVPDECGEWGFYSDCSADCGGGEKTRVRTCQHVLSDENWEEEDTQECNTNECPVNGGWGEFRDWSACPVECGGGQQQRFRECNNPAPANGGEYCVGDSEEVRECNNQDCPESKLRATCDDILEVYVDGVKQSDTDNSFINWPKESVFQKKFRSVALKCENVGGPAGILASIENDQGTTILSTDSSWKCTSTPEEGWTETDFSTANWQNAVKVGDHGDSPWGTIGDISPDADWIWLSGNPLTIYCRITLGN